MYMRKIKFVFAYNKLLHVSANHVAIIRDTKIFSLNSLKVKIEIINLYFTFAFLHP